MDDQRTFTVTSNLIAVLAGNPGLIVSPNLFISIANGDVVIEGGCIRWLRYGNDDDDLIDVRFDNGDSLNSVNATNLNDFRHRFQDAANHGLGATYCRNKTTNTINMVNLYPCLCTCREGEGPGKGKPGSDFFPLSGS